MQQSMEQNPNRLCDNCQEKDANKELKCGHLVCHSCIFKAIGDNNQHNIICCGKSNSQTLDLSFLPPSFPPCEDLGSRRKKTKPDEQKYNWKMSSHDFTTLIEIFTSMIGPHAENGFIKEALIVLPNIDLLSITFKLKKKTLLSTLRTVIPESIQLEGLNGQVDFFWKRIELSIQECVFIKHITNQDGNNQIYDDFIQTLKMMKEKDFI